MLVTLGIRKYEEKHSTRVQKRKTQAFMKDMGHEENVMVADEVINVELSGNRPEYQD